MNIVGGSVEVHGMAVRFLRGFSHGTLLTGLLGTKDRPPVKRRKKEEWLREGDL